MAELKGGGRGGVEGGGRRIIWSVFSRVPALCSLLQPGLCVPVYKAPCARTRGKLNHVFFICSVLPLQQSQNLSCWEGGNIHQGGVFLSKSLFFCLWKATRLLFFPLWSYFSYICKMSARIPAAGRKPSSFQTISWLWQLTVRLLQEAWAKEGEREGSMKTCLFLTLWCTVQLGISECQIFVSPFCKIIGFSFLDLSSSNVPVLQYLSSL